VAQNYFATGEAPKRYGNAHPNIVPYEVFPTSDGHIALAIGTDDQFKTFCAAVDRQDLWLDGRFCKNSGRVEHRHILIPCLCAIFAERATGEWLSLLSRHHIPAGPINDIPTLLADPQVAARQMVGEVEHPTLGKIKQLGPVARLSKTPARMLSSPPLLGEHTEVILRQELGYTFAEVERLRRVGVI
jgi:formyl-CoA transferase